MQCPHRLPWLLFAVLLSCLAAPGQDVRRNAWYWDSVVNLHIDNHSGLVGKGHSVEELADMVRAIDVDMIQVSALGANGITTYQTDIRRHPQLEDWDTIAAWHEVARRLNRRFGVYINTRGLRMFEDHPDWIQVDARGRGRGRNGGLDICMRPSPDGHGPLEQVFLPLLAEIGARTAPDALWVDGDHARTVTCYCPRCAAAWEAETGMDSPPHDETEPNWSRWLRFEQDRFDEYRRRMAAAIHEAAPGCMYTSNHSWRFRTRDPRSAPDWVDTLSGDLSHGQALRATRLSAMQLAPEILVPCDIMHNIMSIASGSSGQPSRRRILQQGALTLACGGAWFLWAPGSRILQHDAQRRATECADFAQARRPALGRTWSLNSTAVLVSETAWACTRLDGETGVYDPTSPEHAALALQDAWYDVDMTNERLLREALPRYTTVVLANQRIVAPPTMRALERFVHDGGLLVVTGGGLARMPAAPELLGLQSRDLRQAIRRCRFGDRLVPVATYWEAIPDRGHTLVRFEEGGPLLTVNHVGRGRVAYLALDRITYPDDAGILDSVMAALDCGPAFTIGGPGQDRHLVGALRIRPDHAIVHLTDLTSTVNGRRVVPTTRNDIDEPAPIETLDVDMPYPVRPQRIAVVPPSVKVAHAWRDGILHLTLENMDVHAAVIISPPPKAALAYLPADRPRAPSRSLPVMTSQDMESLPIGPQLPEGLGRFNADGNTAIGVTLTTAASGLRSLRFSDHPEARQPFFPYWAIPLRGLDSGIGYVSVDLRLDGAVTVDLEMREVENARDFPVGPSVRLTAGRPADGRGLRGAPDRLLAPLPPDTWFHVDLIVPFDGSGTYDLRLHVPGEPPREFAGLPCRSPDFVRAGWLGIIGMGTEAGTFHVDNLSWGRVATREEVPPPPAIEPHGGIPDLDIAPEPALLAYWRFDGRHGDLVVDSSGNGLHAESPARRVPGRVGQALRLEGSREQSVAVADAPPLRFGTDSFTIDLWLRPEHLQSPKGFRRLVEKNNYPETWWNIDLLADGRLELEMQDDAGTRGTTQSDGTLEIGSWHHVAIVVDREAHTVTYWIDGRRDSTKPLPQAFKGAVTVSDTPLHIGAITYPYAGDLDELRIYGQALDAETIRRHATR